MSEKKKPVLCICPPKQIGKTLMSIEKMIRHLGYEGKIVVEESGCQRQRDKLLEACKYTRNLLSNSIGQHTNALVMIEAAIAEAEKKS